MAIMVHIAINQFIYCAFSDLPDFAKASVIEI